VVRRLRDQGVAVIYISHRLEEIAALADACVVLRDGKVAARIDGPPFAPDVLIRAMTGRDMKPGGGATTRERGELRIERPLDGGGSLKCHRGEVIGLGGLLGSGTATLLHHIFGSQEGGHRREEAVKAAIAGGTGLVPGERARALVMPMSISDNIVLPHLDAFTHAFGRDEKRIAHAVAQLMDLLDIRPRAPQLPVRNLSGGNQQKVAFAKWLVGKLELLLLDEPTNGIDIAAKALIHQRIAAFAESGGSVILSSSDMPELLDLSDAVVVLRQGRLAGHMERAGDFGEPRLRTLLGVGL
jgi:ribose transport system ATP-binding protein